ncbi:MAG: PE-PGRS family protein [Sandaracinus sp.]
MGLLRFALVLSLLLFAAASGCATGRPVPLENDASVDASRPRDSGIPVDAPCAAGEQRCDGVCRAADDPRYGCGASSCTACAPPAGAVARCEGGTCAFDCDAGRIDLDGDPSNGCEYACARSGDLDLVDAAFVDANCDGTDGVLASCVFVSAAHGDDASADGTRAAPYATIGAALSAATTLGRRSVCVAGGDYAEALVVPAGIDVLGGFDDADAVFPYRRSASATTTVHATGAVLTIPSATLPAQIAGLTIACEGPGTDGSSYGVLVLAGSAPLAIDDDVITVAAGADGARGDDGVPAAMPAPTGNAGADGTASSSSGGTGTSSPSCAERGGRGGDGGFSDMDGMMGSTGSGGASGGPIGMASRACGTPSMGGGTGQAGGRGGAGMAGTGGMGLGTLGANGYLPAAGRMGGNGANGRGGGGGGGGGGGSCTFGGSCTCAPDRAGGGGSGGCGGVGGPPGLGGAGGGGSFGIVIAEGSVVISDCTITTGDGGEGGRGGDGASGQVHGDGGPGGAAADDGGRGGMGGPGGDGGAGGPGGGGGGGPSACVARASGASATVTTTRCMLGAAGPGGSGGTNSVGAIGGLGTSGVASAQVVLP